MPRGFRTAIAAALPLVAAGCGGDEEPTPEPTTSPADPASESPTESEPATPEPAAPLDWRPTGHSVDERVIVGEKWTAIATESDVRFESNTADADDVSLPATGSTSAKSPAGRLSAKRTCI